MLLCVWVPLRVNVDVIIVVHKKFIKFGGYECLIELVFICFERFVLKYMEVFAEIEHDRWSGWMKYMFTKGHEVIQNDIGMTWQMNIESYEMWQRKMLGSYSDLSVAEKGSDRVEVVKMANKIFSYRFEKKVEVSGD